MIRTSLEFIKRELESYLIERDAANYSAGSAVELESIVSPGGTVIVKDAINISISMVGIEEDKREGKHPYYIPTTDNKYQKLYPPVDLNIYVLFTAHIKEYSTSLRDISNVISFFQSNPVFDQNRYPNLNAEAKEPIKKPWEVIDRLSFKLHNLTFEQQNNLWGMIGSKYIPSVLYKVNMLTIFETKSKEQVASINELNLNEN